MRLAATLLPESDGLLFGLPKLLLILVSWTVSLQDGADLVCLVFCRWEGKGVCGGVKWTSYVFKICHHLSQIRKIIGRILLLGFI